MSHVCDDCGDRFDTKRGLKTHIGKMHDPLPEEKLREMYIQQGMSGREISRRVPISYRGVADRLSKYDLWGKGPVNVELFPDDGYPVIRNTGVTGKARRVRVHRLLAIAGGADAHDIFSGEYDVHHKNGIKFDNRPSNIEVIGHAEHASLHQQDETENSV